MLAAPASREGHLHSNNNSPVVCLVVAVVKQADVPVGTQGTGELHQTVLNWYAHKNIDLFTKLSQTFFTI